jgi:hypothetical protein
MAFQKLFVSQQEEKIKIKSILVLIEEKVFLHFYDSFFFSLNNCLILFREVDIFLYNLIIKY